LWGFYKTGGDASKTAAAQTANAQISDVEAKKYFTAVTKLTKSQMVQAKNEVWDSQLYHLKKDQDYIVTEETVYEMTLDPKKPDPAILLQDSTEYIKPFL